MILIDEKKLTLGMIGNKYGKFYDHSKYDDDSYEMFIHSVVEEFYVGDKEEIIDFFKKI
jgi:hypothetical protein